MIKRLITVVLFSALAAIHAAGQAQPNRFPPINLVAGDPTGTACPANSIVQSSTSGVMYTCQGGAYRMPGGTSIPPTMVTWPPSCTTGTYIPATNTCVPTGTAANPGGSPGQTQINAGGGTFIGIPGSVTDVTNGWKTQGGIQYAKGWQSGGGNDGIVNAAAANQIVIADPTYATTEQPGPFSFSASPFHFQDLRLGQTTHFFRNTYQSLFNFGVYPLNRAFPAATSTYCLYDQQTNVNSTNGSGTCDAVGQQMNAPGYDYGNFGGTYTGWAGGNMGIRVYQTRQSGNHNAMYIQQDKYGLGDHLGVTALLYNDGGMVAASDEGQEAGNFQTNEHITAFSATCNTGCTTGSQSIKTSVANGTQGAGRYLIDASSFTLSSASNFSAGTTTYTGTALTTACPSPGVTNFSVSGFGNPANNGTWTCVSATSTTLILNNPAGIAETHAGTALMVVMTGQITNIAAGIGGASAYTITGVSATPSTAWGTILAAAQTPLPAAPPFTSSVTFTVNAITGTFTAGSLICFSGNFHEQAVIATVTNGSGPTATITANLRRSHITGVVMQGGPCGQGLEIPAFTYGGLKYLFDVIGATDASTLQVVRFIGGTAGINVIPVQIYQTMNFTNATLSGGTTVTFAATNTGTLGTPWRITEGGSILFTGSSDSALNAICTNVHWVAPTGTATGTCTIAGLSGTHTTTTPMSATLVANGVPMNSFATYQIAEVTDVQNETLTPPQVDGTLALEPNLIPFVTGHTVVETHHYSSGYVGVKAVANPQNPFARLTTVQITNSGKGIGAYSDVSNAGMSYLNNEPLPSYLGYGGNLTAPPVLFAQGPYTNLIQAHEPPTNGGSVISIANNPVYSNIASANVNLFSITGKPVNAWTANFNLFNGDVTESVPRVFTIGGLVNFAAPTFGASTSVGPITFALMTTPTLTVTCITTGGQLAAGTYAYRIQARGGSFFSPQSAEVPGTVASGTTGSCNLSWTPVAGATTSYLVSGRTAGATAQIVAVQNGIGGTTYTDVGVITPSGSPQVTVQPGVDNAGYLGMLSSGTAFELKLQAPAGLAATTTITVTKIAGVSITPAAVTASTCAEQTFATYTGLATTQIVTVSPPAFLGAHVWIASTRVSATNTLAIAFCADATGGTPAAGVYLAMAF